MREVVRLVRSDQTKLQHRRGLTVTPDSTRDIARDQWLSKLVAAGDKLDTKEIKLAVQFMRNCQSSEGLQSTRLMAMRKYVPNDRDREIVLQLAAITGITHEQVAFCITNERTKKPITAKTLRKHFARELETGTAKRRQTK